MSNKSYLELAARDVEKRLPDNHGFLLLTMPFGADGRLSYTANINREDAIKVLKEFLFNLGQSENWMQHIK